MKLHETEEEMQKRLDKFLRRTNSIDQKMINFLLFDQHAIDHCEVKLKMRALSFLVTINTAFAIGWIISRFI